MKPYAVFLDRDGTMIEERNYLCDPREAVLIEGAAEAIRRLSERGYRIIMVTNQSGVARGMFPEEMVHQVNRRVEELLRAQGARLDAVYYCPHHPKGIVPKYACRCTCRKPQPGMGLRAAAENGIALDGSYMIGDKPDDVQFAKNCGMRQGFLVSTGHGYDALLPEGYGVRVKDLLTAAEAILQDGNEKEKLWQ